MKLALIEGFDSQVCEFVAARSPFGHTDFKMGDRGFAVVNPHGTLLAGIVFSGWQPHFGAVELSVVAVSSCCFSPGIVAAMGHYAFRQLCCNRVWARTSTKNHRAIKALRHLGFTPEGVHADFYGVGRHAETYRMLKREWVSIHAPREEERHLKDSAASHPAQQVAA